MTINSRLNIPHPRPHKLEPHSEKCHKMPSRTLLRNWPLLMATFAGGLLLMGFSHLSSSRNSTGRVNLPQQQPGNPTEEETNILDGCHHVYLDMGSNIGIQIRKLYEPEHFPNAKMLPIFDQFFGSPQSRRRPGAVCAVGWEPNPEHTPALVRLEEVYKACGWKVKIHTEMGVGSVSGKGHFKKMGNRGEGSQIRDSWKPRDKTSPAVTIRIAQFINTVVATRRLPGLPGDGPELRPAVIMKLDVEGKEMEVIPDLVMSGALAHLDTLHVDWHKGLDKEERETQKAIQFLTRLGNRMNLSHVTQVDSTDDESYNDFGGELPNC